MKRKNAAILAVALLTAAGVFGIRLYNYKSKEKQELAEIKNKLENIFIPKTEDAIERLCSENQALQDSINFYVRYLETLDAEKLTDEPGIDQGLTENINQMNNLFHEFAKNATFEHEFLRTGKNNDTAPDGYGLPGGSNFFAKSPADFIIVHQNGDKAVEERKSMGKTVENLEELWEHTLVGIFNFKTESIPSINEGASLISLSGNFFETEHAWGERHRKYKFDRIEKARLINDAAKQLINGIKYGFSKRGIKIDSNKTIKELESVVQNNQKLLDVHDATGKQKSFADKLAEGTENLKLEQGKLRIYKNPNYAVDVLKTNREYHKSR